MLSVLTACSNQESKESKTSKDKIIVYGDFKCPYCKQLEEEIIPKLKKDYIEQGKVEYQFVNMAFLGDDSIIGSRAGHAVENIDPNEYLRFQELMFSHQPDNEKKWITEKLVDKQIDKLNISNNKAKKIKIDYKKKNSQSWRDAKKDQKIYKKNNIQEAPTVVINGKEIQDVYDYKEYKKYLK
ncbi:DsbA family protein [Staphylococcus epidermidis]|nr:thioredoxin domain-containing protein [Staphylococcus epidermidis]NKZ44546.1 thioredoxin domain-containing protein [Shewanella algae]PCH17809.1 protein-disulfide isomerase [Campylobacter sp. 114]MBF8103444.1 thioredoxin domain-containing protein [Staphylococcus epidermidis]MBM6147178.1 thioredoxin domain-containing protein [Staphylococcus epidermidis]MBM6156118.1 thioredoxin domain-containing protein [Staphylococcus epidermidis]